MLKILIDFFLVSFSLFPSRFSLPDNPTNPQPPFSFGPGHSGHGIGRQEHLGIAQPLVRPSPSRIGVQRHRNRAKQPTILTAKFRFRRRSFASPLFQLLPCSVRPRSTLSWPPQG